MSNKTHYNLENGVILLNVECKDCNMLEIWSLNELKDVESPIECVECEGVNMDITLNNSEA